MSSARGVFHSESYNGLQKNVLSFSGSLSLLNLPVIYLDASKGQRIPRAAAAAPLSASMPQATKNPPKFPSCANMGEAVRKYDATSGRWEAVAPSRDAAAIYDIVPLGLSAGVIYAVSSLCACARDRWTAPVLVVLTVCALPAQWLRKKHTRRPFNVGDFTPKWVYAATAASHWDAAGKKTWLQEIGGTPGEAQMLLETINEMDVAMPHRWMLSKTDVEKAFITSINAGEMSKTYQGEHGIPGLAWPPLEDHDENAAAITGEHRPCAAPRSIREASHMCTTAHAPADACVGGAACRAATREGDHDDVARAHDDQRARRVVGFLAEHERQPDG